MHTCKECPNAPNNLFCGLKDESLSRLNSIKVEQHYAPGQVLFYEGNPPLGLYCVESGVVKAERHAKSGLVQLLQIYGGASVLGYRALFVGDTHEATATAVEDTRVCFVPKAFFLDLVKAEPNLGFALLGRIAKEVRAIEDRFQHQVADSASSRVAEALISVVGDHPEHTWSRKDLAAWAGTTPETVMRVLTEFEAKKWIARKGRKILIQDKVALKNESL